MYLEAEDPTMAKNKDCCRCSSMHPSRPLGETDHPSTHPSSLPRWFLGFTSIGGLGQLGSTDLTISRVIWAVLFVVGAVMTAVNVHQVLSDYSKRPIVTVTALHTRQRLDFPAVTLCNHNLVHCGNLRQKIVNCTDANGKFTCSPPQLESQLCSLYLLGECGNAVIAAEKFSLGGASFQEDNDPVCSQTGWNESYLNSLEASGEVGRLFQRSYAQLSPEVRREIAHSPSDMFKTCSFDGVFTKPACSDLVVGAVTQDSSVSGVCYTFNFNKTLENASDAFVQEITHLSGPGNGLALDLDLGTDYYLGRGVTREEGIKVIVHSPNLTPLITVSGGFNIRANEQSNLALREESIIRQPPPYASLCANQWPSQLSNVAVAGGVNYQTRLCHLACAVQRVAGKCGCAHAVEVGLNNVDLCSGAQAVCVSKHLLNDSATGDCGCRPMCSEKTYQGVLTTARWPSSRALAATLNQFGLKYQNGSLDPETYEKMMLEKPEEAEAIQTAIRSRMARLLVYFDDLLVVDVTESPKYSAFSLMSSLGGAVSLYLGVSLVAVFELVEIPLHLIAAAFAPKGNKH